MKSILEELYNGSVYPAEQVCPADPEYHPLNKEIVEEIDYFISKMSEEDRQRFDKLDELFNRSSYMYATASFVHGFRLAALMMIDVYSGKGRLTRSEE